MFPSFISILDIQSWWEVPSIAHFCSLFRAAFNLLDFDIEELEEALLTDGTEDSGSSLLQELIVRLLCGCLANNDVSTFNYQMFLRRLFRQKCQEHGRYNPFNTDIDFQFLPLRTKVEILHALCDFRLDAEDVLELLKNLEAESLRVEPLGYDDNESAYWYFYGTRLYREDYEKGTKKSKQKKTIWQVVCFTEQDWTHLTSKFKAATSKTEKALYRSLSENFLPEIPRLFQEKERLQRKRLLELQPRRTSSRVQKLREQNEESCKSAVPAEHEVATPKPVTLSARELRAIQRDASRSGSEGGSRAPSPAMPSQAPSGGGTTSVGRQTNNSLASATGQILIQSVANTHRKKLKTSQVFRQTEEDLQTGMYKILEFVKNHDDAWPFIEPVEEDYAPNYYSIVRKPMDLQRMEDKLDAGEYLSYSRFKADFQLIVDNCRLYNGTDNEYTEMVDNLQQAFDRATDRFLDQISSSDEDIAVEFQGTSKEKEKEVSSKKNKRLKKENKQTSKRKSSPSISEKKEFVEKTKTRKSPGPQEASTEVSTRKSRQMKKEASTSVKEKPREKSPSNVRSVAKNKRASISPIVHRRNKSKSRSWTSSPSPPPPRIQKKKKIKDNPTPETKPISPPKPNNTDKNKKWDAFINETEKIRTTHKSDIAKKSDIFQSQKNFEKERNSNLSETIEKLKKNSSKMNDLFEFVPESNSEREQEKQKVFDRHKKDRLKEKPKEKRSKVMKKKHEIEFDTESSSNTKDSFVDNKKNTKKPIKKTGVMKNPAAIEALALATEQTLKDINKWLDDTPKFQDFSPPNDSPVPLPPPDDFESVTVKIENEYKANLKLNKPTNVKVKELPKDVFKRRPMQKDFSKLHKRREVQRTIDRLQPGKSKGNLIANIQSNKTEDVGFLSSSISKIKDAKNSLLVNPDDTAPKLSLGTVLDSFGQQHNFVDDVEEKDTEMSEGKPITKENIDVNETLEETVTETEITSSESKEIEAKTSVKSPPKQENVTPNLSAWFKAFGTPKSVTAPKKKSETEQETIREPENIVSPIAADERFVTKPNELAEDLKKSPMPSPAPDLPSGPSQPVPRTRKASTGSSISERSSFSQDMMDPLDSPRLSLDERLGGYPAPYPSPLHRSPVAASPRLDENQRHTPYPPLNGNIRVGFYQDTVKSSPEKSCSPREQPQSPHLQLSHVYIPPPLTYQYSNPPSCAEPSPNQSPVYTQSQPPPSYSSTVNSTSYYESSKLLKEYTATKTPDVFDGAQPLPEGNTLNSKSDLPLEANHHSKIQQTNTIIPVKKRLYNECMETEHTSNRISPHSNVSRLHNSIDMGLYMNRDLDTNISGRPMNLNSEQEFMNTEIPTSQSIENMVSVTGSAKNYTTPEVGFPNDQSTTDGRTIETPRRGLNVLNSLNAPPLNIPNPIKTIDLTGPDSPVYKHQTNMNMSLDMGIQHSRLASKPTNMYEHSENSDSMSQYSRQDNIPRNVQTNSKNLMGTQDNTPSASINNTQNIYSSRNIPVDMNIHHSRLGMNTSDLRIPSVRTENLNTVAHSPLSLSNMGNQDLSNVGQRNEYAHQNIRPSDRLAMQSGINMSLSSTIPSSTYNNSSASIGLDPALSLRGNLGNLTHIVDRYQNDDRLLSNLPNTTSPFYPTDKTLTSQTMFSKGIPTSLHSATSNSVSPMFSQPNAHMNTPSTLGYHTSAMQSQMVKTTTMQPTAQIEKKSRRRKSKVPSPNITSETPVNTSNQGFQSYAGLKSNTLSTEPSAISLKTASVVPGSAFNFGPAPPALGLSTGLYNDKDGYGGFIDEYRNPATNYYMAAAAAAAHHRSTPEVSNEKSQRPTAQTNPASGSYPFLSHPQSRPPAYPGLPSPFMNPHQAQLMEPSSPLYQQYFQRHQEEILRHSGVLHQGLLAPPAGYPPGYPLGMRQPFDTINRPSWL